MHDQEEIWRELLWPPGGSLSQLKVAMYASRLWKQIHNLHVVQNKENQERNTSLG
jgi:hypothetical protein